MLCSSSCALTFALPKSIASTCSTNSSLTSSRTTVLSRRRHRLRRRRQHRQQCLQEVLRQHSLPCQPQALPTKQQNQSAPPLRVGGVVDFGQDAFRPSLATTGVVVSLATDPGLRRVFHAAMPVPISPKSAAMQRAATMQTADSGSRGSATATPWLPQQYLHQRRQQPQ